MSVNNPDNGAASDHDTAPPDPHIIHVGAFLRTAIAPLMLWGTTVLLATAAGQPGVGCLTPMAWLYALWAGAAYVRLSGGRPDRIPLLGPALVGVALGFGMSAIFIVVSRQAMPVGDDAGEIEKARNLTAVISVAGAIICALFSVFTAALTLRRLRRSAAMR